MNDHLIRLGSLGQIGRFQSPDGKLFERNMSVICRTRRGLEFGGVLNRVSVPSPGLTDLAGQIVRGATAEDHLLWARLEKHRIEALDRCQRWLDQRQLTATLMDCEVLFDGRSIFFYFLGTVSGEVEALTTELAATYEAAAKIKQFADAMTLGCGPDCGTKDCSDGGCSTCAIAGACKVEGRTS